MNKKVLTISAIGMMFVAMSCQSNPAEKAENEANAHADQAVKEANASAQQQQSSDVNAANAVVNAAIANADDLMAQVPMPNLSDHAAKGIATSIGNHVVEYVNAKDNSKATQYQEKVTKELAKVDEMVAKKKITAADATAIKDYATKLGKAAGLIQ